jgi:hypothetical protein
MKINRLGNVVGLYVAAALVVTLSGLAITTTSLNIVGAASASAFEGHACVLYQTYPAQADCTAPINHNNNLITV